MSLICKELLFRAHDTLSLCCRQLTSSKGNNSLPLFTIVIICISFEFSFSFLSFLLYLIFFIYFFPTSFIFFIFPHIRLRKKISSQLELNYSELPFHRHIFAHNLHVHPRLPSIIIMNRLFV